MCFKKNLLRYSVLIIFLSSCANIVAPTGGEKDITAPVVIKLYPKDSTTLFLSSKIAITFNENITIKDPQNGVVISPSLGTNGFSAESQTNKLLIKLANLKPNTTYTISAKNTIADITEGNTLSSLKYVFSTGTQIDSLKLSGVVIDAITLQPCSASLVCLYRNLEDSIILKQEPDYFTLSDIKGNFALENIKPGVYKLAVIEDKNKNLLWNEEEELAFVTEPIRVDSSNKQVVIRQFKQPVNKNYLVSSKSSSMGVYEFVFHKFNANDSGQYVIINQEDPSTDKTQRYLQHNIQDACFVPIYKSFITSNLHSKDSAHFNYYINHNLYKTAIKISQQKVFLPLKTIYTTTDNTPVLIPFIRTLDTASLDIKKIKIFNDTNELKNISLRADPLLGLTIENLMAGSYKAVFAKGAISDYFGEINDSFMIQILVYNTAELPSLIYTFDTIQNRKYKLRIVNSDMYCSEKILEPSKAYKFSHLLPGQYKIWVSEISDDYNRPFTGDYFKHIQPEKFVYYKELNIKIGFDIEEKLVLLDQ